VNPRASLDECREFRPHNDSICLDCLTLKDDTDMLYRNVGNYKSMLRNIVEEQKSH